MVRTILAAVALLALPGAARAEWHEASTERFVVYSDDSPERLRQFATNLERLDKAMRLHLTRPDTPVGKANRITVYVLDDVADVRRLAGSADVAGFYTPRAGGTAAFVPRRAGTEEGDLSALEILLHEYAHHFLFSGWPNAAYPRWFAEGFAEFYATAKFERDGSVTLGYPPQYRAHGIMTGDSLPIDKLLTADTRKLTGEQTDLLYGRGWLMTHYFLLGSERQRELGAYIDAINKGKPSLEAAQAFGDLKVLDRELQRYRKGKLAAVQARAAALKVGEVAVRRLGAGEAATMEVRIRSKRGVDAKTAPAVYAAAKRACAPYPDDPAAQVVLAEAAYDAEDYAAAEAAADRAIAADPKAIDAHVYKAMARMAVALKADDTSKETWSAIRRSIVAANRIDPEDPEPLILFFRSFVEAGQEPSKSARAGFYYAAALAPHDRALRLNVAQAYIADGDPAEARAMLLALAYDAHNPGLAGAANALIARIDKGEIHAKGDAPAEPSDTRSTESELRRPRRH